MSDIPTTALARAGVLTPDGARLAEVLARIARRLTSDNRPTEVSKPK